MNNQLRLALYQPDMPANTGAIMRLCACLGLPLDVIEPCGFVLDDQKLRRAAMDYIDHLEWRRHASWEVFQAQRTGKFDGRLVLLTTKAAISCYDFDFRPGDVLLAGRESAGVPDEVHRAADARILVPMKTGPRSLNVAMACAITVSEALRQLKGFST